MKKFDEFVNEARKKFPEHKVGDLLLAGNYHEFQWKNSVDSTSWETYYKYASSKWQGALLKVVKVDIEKKEYVAEFIGGILKTVYRGRSSGGSFLPYTDTNRKIYLRVKHSDKLSQEGTSEALKFLENNVLKPREKVSVRLSKDRSVTRDVIGVSLIKSIEEKKLHYEIEGVSGAVSIDRIEKEIDVTDDTAVNLLAEEIGKITGAKIDEIKGSGSNTEFVFDTEELEGKDLITGKLYFKNISEKDKFCEDLKKFIESKLDEKLQKVMNGGEASVVNVTNTSSSIWRRGIIKKSKIVQAARNLGINIQEFLEKKKGVITGKKYGL